MDFQTLKRRDLQALCKLNNIPANLTNAAMADALNSLHSVKGIEDLLEQLEIRGSESPEKSVSRTSTRQKPPKEGLECSEMATRTRCGARRVAIEGTDTGKTTTARTTRRRATQEASSQREMEKDMQAKFKEDLEQSDVSENSGVESTETSEVSQSELEHRVAEVNNDGEVVDVGDDKEESVEMSNNVQKLDFHCLGRKDLQNLCKRNKIPANMTNAAMADALGSLDTVEGLEEFLEGYDPLAIKSPETSRMTSSRLRQARTAGNTAGRKSARAGSALCKSLARKLEELNEENQECPLSMSTNEGGTSVEVGKDLQSHLDEGCLEKSEFIGHVSENISTINGESKSEAALVTELHDEMVENKCDGRGNDTSEEFEANLSAVILGQEFSTFLEEVEVKLQDDALEFASNDQEVNVNSFEESDMAELIITDTNCSNEPNIDKCLTLETPETDISGLDECIELNDMSADTVTLESESDTNLSEECHGKGLMQDAPAVTIKGLSLSDLEAHNEDFDGLPDTENSTYHLKFANEDVSEEEDSDVAESISSVLDIDIEPAANCGINNEYVESGSAFEGISDVAAPVNEPEDDDAENCISEKFVSETATQASQHAPKVKATPLCRKSLRKLKKLVKEKLQETTLLAKRLENLTLQDNEITIGISNSDIDAVKKVEENVGEVLSGDVIADAVEPFNETDGVDQQVATGTQPTESGALKQAGELSSKAPKPLVFTTPSKSSSKTPMSAGRTIRVLDANKENIDSATRTTEAGKIKIVVTPAMSMGKLKKEVKVLLEQSEKKRPALQSRSDNQCSLTSP